MRNFSDKYFVLVLHSYCLKQFPLFQNYTERASSLITVLDKERDSSIGYNGTNREAVSTSEDLIKLAPAVSEHWTEHWPKISVSRPVERGKLEHLCSIQQGNFAMSRAGTIKSCPREARTGASVLHSCFF